MGRRQHIDHTASKDNLGGIREEIILECPKLEMGMHIENVRAKNHTVSSWRWRSIINHSVSGRRNNRGGGIARYCAALKINNLRGRLPLRFAS